MKIHLPSGADGWQMAMGAYAGCQALALWMTPVVFQQDAYAIMRALPLTRIDVMIMLGGYTAATLVCLLFGNATRWVSLGIFGIAMWLFFGVSMIASALTMGSFLSPAGMFEILCSVGCAISVRQWGFTE